MQTSCIQHCARYILTLMFITTPTLAYTSVKVRLHQSAKLPCNSSCSDLVKWTLLNNPDHSLAQCNQTRCESKEGYKISRDQYLNGDLSLTITSADYSKRGYYTCQCGDRDLWDVRLIIETTTPSVQINPGGDLVMDLSVPEPVDVIYKPIDSAGLYGEQICTVTNTLQCKHEYTPRTSLRYLKLTLRHVTLSDGGTYTIRDRKNDEDIHIYTLIVKVVKTYAEETPVDYSVIWWILGIVLPIVFGVIVGVVCCVVKKNQQIKGLQQENIALEETRQLQELVTEENQWLKEANSKLLELITKLAEIEKLTQQFITVPVKRSQSLNSLIDIPEVELLKRKKAEIDKIVQSMGTSEQDPFRQCWSEEKSRLDWIIEHWRNYDVDQDELQQSQPHEERMRANSSLKRLQLMRQMVEVDSKIQPYYNRTESYTSLKGSDVASLHSKMSGIDETFQSMGISEDEPIGLWWRKQKPKVESVIQYGKTRDFYVD